MNDDSSRRGSTVSGDSRPDPFEVDHVRESPRLRALPDSRRSWSGLGVAALAVVLPGLFAFMFSVGAGRSGWGPVALVGVVLILVLIAPVVLALLARHVERRRVRRPQWIEEGPDQRRPTIEELATDLRALADEFAAARVQAERVAHPLLAREFAATGERLTELRQQAPAGGRAGAEWRMAAQSLARPDGPASRRRLRRRLLAAQLAYQWNLPLTRGAAANFAVAAMAERIDRLTGAISGYLTPAQPGGSDV